MAVYSLEGDTTGLPRTETGSIPYEIDAFTAARTFGHGGSSMQVICNQKWEVVPDWALKMVGRVYVATNGSMAAVPKLARDLPEPARKNPNLWCTSLVPADNYGRPVSGQNHADAQWNWPATKRSRYRAVFENLPYDVLSDQSVDAYRQTANDAHTFGGVNELYRYLERMQKAYSVEQRIPALGKSGGFKIAEGVDKGKPLGQAGMRKVSLADVVYKWHRVPVGWPPPKGWTPPPVPQFGNAGYWPPRVNPINPAQPEKIPARDRFKGTVNDDWFDVGPIGGYAFAPETLRYIGYDDSFKYWDAAGVWVCDYVFNFQFKEGGWNKFLSARGDWVRATLDGETTGTPVYETNDFNYLFEYEA